MTEAARKKIVIVGGGFAGVEKRLRVAIDWTWDLIFSKDLVQFLSRRRETISQPQAEVADAMRRAAG
jgi:hypothetical protein